MALSKGNPIVTALTTGNPEGYSALYDRLGLPLLRTARAMLRTSGEAEDAVQDVFVELARNRDRLTLVRDLDAYVFAMLRHTVQRRLKRKNIEQQHLRQLATIPAAESHSDSSDDDLAVALASLPVKQQEIVALKVNSGLTFAQIAEVLNISQNTAASRYRYAIEKLRQILGTQMNADKHG